MKVIVAETLYPDGHKVLDDLFIKTISSFASVTLVNSRGYFSHNSQLCCERVISIKRLEPKAFEVIYFLCYLINYVLLAISLRHIQYDKIVFLSTRTDSLFFAHWLFKKNSIVVVHHNDIDRMISRGYEVKIFKSYMNSITHVVLAQFIKDGLVSKTGVDEDLVYVVHQPLINEHNTVVLHHQTRSPLIVSLGQSTDPEFVERLISYMNSKSPDLIYKIAIKSKSIKYDGPKLSVYNKYLSREEFETILLTASACLVVYPDSYRLRYSGIIDDALSHGLFVICNDIDVCRYFAQRYPGCVKIINSVDELISIASSRIPTTNMDEIKTFYQEHSLLHVASQWKKAVMY